MGIWISYVVCPRSECQSQDFSLGLQYSGSLHFQVFLMTSHTWIGFWQRPFKIWGWENHQSEQSLAGTVPCMHACSVAKPCLTFCDSVDCSPPGSSVHGISQARILAWVAISFIRHSQSLTLILWFQSLSLTAVNKGSLQGRNAAKEECRETGRKGKETPENKDSSVVCTGFAPAAAPCLTVGRYLVNIWGKRWDKGRKKKEINRLLPEVTLPLKS